MKETIARGGAKPRMLAGSRDLGLTIGESRKYGMYEISAKGDCLARRVELPAWLSEEALKGRPTELLGRLAGGLIRPPAEEVRESKGHIYLSPPAELFAGPAVGLDMEIARERLEDARLKSIRFCVYATGYDLFVSWTVSAADFMAKAKRVESRPPFMPQMMIALADLRHPAR